MKAFKEVHQQEGTPDRFYWVKVVCRNCGFKDSVACLKGSSLSDHSCPDCECYTLERY